MNSIILGIPGKQNQFIVSKQRRNLWTNNPVQFKYQSQNVTGNDFQLFNWYNIKMVIFLGRRPSKTKWMFCFQILVIKAEGFCLKRTIVRWLDVIRFALVLSMQGSTVNESCGDNQIRRYSENLLLFKWCPFGHPHLWCGFQFVCDRSNVLHVLRERGPLRGRFQLFWLFPT